MITVTQEPFLFSDDVRENIRFAADDISEDEIKLRVLVDHSEGDKYSPSVERSLYIEDLLYTKSPKLLRINDLEDDLSSVKNVVLKPGTSGDMKIV